MRIGVLLPTIGDIGGPDAIRKVATRAEDLGYDSLWVSERVLYPLAPRSPYASPDGELEDTFKRNLGPIESLAFAAACTSRIELGTSVLNIPFYNPVLLARSLATLDILSNGRALVGLGMGWSEDEFEATGAPARDRGRRADEFLRVLKAAWTDDPVEFRGEFYTVPRSIIDAKPVRKPHPPIYLAAYAPGSMRRVATLSDGWMPAGIPAACIEQMFGAIIGMTTNAGRDPEEIDLIVRANVSLRPAPVAGERPIFTGTLEQIAADIADVQGLGASKVIFDLSLSSGCQDLSRLLERLQLLRDLAWAAQPDGAVAV